MQNVERVIGKRWRRDLSLTSKGEKLFVDGEYVESEGSWTRTVRLCDQVGSRYLMLTGDARLAEAASGPGIA
jgi:hypothetical protein